MRTRLMETLSYLLATAAGLCLFGGLAILAGGILLSASLLFGGLSLTVFTMTDSEE